MVDLIDLHTHSISSGHAYSTLQENIAAAKNKGLKYYGLSDHAPNMPGSAHLFHFNNLHVIRNEYAGVRVLKGAEANLLDKYGNIDLPYNTQKKLDYIIASIHTPCYEAEDSGFDDVTNCYLKACDNPYITVLGHIENGKFLCDFDAVCEYASKTHTLIELNSSSLAANSARKDSYLHMPYLLSSCIKHHTYVLLGSDAHIADDVGNHDNIIKLLEEYNFPKELIVNYDEELINMFIINKCKVNGLKK